MVKPLKKSAHITKILDEKVARIWPGLLVCLAYYLFLCQLHMAVKAAAGDLLQPRRPKWSVRNRKPHPPTLLPETAL